jgi:hypothetical protein
MKKTTMDQNVTKQPVKAEKANFDQIDTIRFLTISIIVWAHSLFSAWYSRVPLELTELIVKTIVIQAGAISTIIFFIVSGILMRSKLQYYNLRTYFIERIPRIYAPWLFIVALNVVLIIIQKLPVRELWISGDYGQFLRSVYDIMSGLLIYGPYWFVVTYFAGMVILICFKQYSANIFFGLFLFVITLFYSLNFHLEWIDTLHTKAILAYTFFIWLGFQIRRYWDNILKGVAKAGWGYFITILLLLFALACYEGFTLAKLGVNDPYASNRFSNILFSLLFFLALLKMGSIKWINNNMKPRKTAYGIYLVNSIVIFEFTLLLDDHLKNLVYLNIWALLLLQLVYFSIILFLTFIIVNFLANTSRLRWVIGGARD